MSARILRGEGREWLLVSRRASPDIRNADEHRAPPSARLLLVDPTNAAIVRGLLAAEVPWPLINEASAEAVTQFFARGLETGAFTLFERPRKMGGSAAVPREAEAVQAEAEEWVEAPPATPEPEMEEDFAVPPNLAAVQAGCNKQAAQSGAPFSAEYQGK
jgi:hypothetical protein